MENTPGVASAAASQTMAAQAALGSLVEVGRLAPRQTILLVEDQAFVRNAAAEVLESAGYNVLAATSAAEAREAYRSLPTVDLLLTDVVLPGMNGRELAREFNSVWPLARILLMSGYADELASSPSTPYCKTHLSKPFSTASLLMKVREALGSNVCGPNICDPTIKMTA